MIWPLSCPKDLFEACCDGPLGGRKKLLNPALGSWWRLNLVGALTHCSSNQQHCSHNWSHLGLRLPLFPKYWYIKISPIQIPNINACGTTQPPTRIGVVPASPLPIMGPKFKICPLYTLSWKPLSVWQFAVVGNGWKLSSDFSHIFASILKIASHPPGRAEENSESESAE